MQSSLRGRSKSRFFEKNFQVVNEEDSYEANKYDSSDSDK